MGSDVNEVSVRGGVTGDERAGVRCVNDGGVGGLAMDGGAKSGGDEWMGGWMDDDVCGG